MPGDQPASPVPGGLGSGSEVGAGLPGATAGGQQILVTTAGGVNSVQVTVCWQAPTDLAPRRHTLVTYVNQ